MSHVVRPSPSHMLPTLPPLYRAALSRISKMTSSRSGDAARSPNARLDMENARSATPNIWNMSDRQTPLKAFHDKAAHETIRVDNPDWMEVDIHG